MNNTISKELFVEAIEDMKKSDDYQNWLNKTMQSKGVEGYLYQPNCVDIVIKLLHNLFYNTDKGDTISYFCLDLDYGRKWKPGSIADKNGKDIDLSTSENLYDYLISEE